MKDDIVDDVVAEVVQEAQDKETIKEAIEELQEEQAAEVEAAVTEAQIDNIQQEVYDIQGGIFSLESKLDRILDMLTPKDEPEETHVAGVEVLDHEAVIAVVDKGPEPETSAPVIRKKHEWI